MMKRSNEPELMDNPDLDAKILRAALDEVTLVNQRLGGYSVTLEGLHRLFKAVPKGEYTILDMGCGDGAMLRKMAAYCRKRRILAQFIGIDLNPKSLEIAREKSTEFSEITYRCQDIMTVRPADFECDIVTSTLTMHHFTDVQILQFMLHFEKLATIGIVINDLQRSRMALRLFRVFSRIFMKTKIARHDGKVSIQRAFTEKELRTYSEQLGFKKYTIEWRWAFRYLWIIHTAPSR
ncbi:MAG: methyltransferase domain-containing protein [Leeuwenhoekiella sp.]